MPYAEKTTVSPEQSRIDIEKLLKKHGATGFMYAQDDEINAVFMEFKMQGRRFRFALPLPEFKEKNSAGTRMTALQARQVQEKAIRQRWRALYLVIKAKLEIVAIGITSLEDEFLSQVVTPENVTVGEWIKPQLKEAYESGAVLPMLPMPRKY